MVTRAVLVFATERKNNVDPRLRSQKKVNNVQLLLPSNWCTSDMSNTVKLEIFADINVCEFVILKVFALLKFAILGIPKMNFVLPQNNVPLLILLIGYIRWLVLFIHIYSLQATG